MHAEAGANRCLPRITAHLGARPLKRAIERFVLAPLAMTIVEHQFPEGDQFLFLRSDGERIQVEFVDPDAPDAGSASSQVEEVAETDRPTLRSLALDPRGDPADVDLMQQSYDGLKNRLGSAPWTERKRLALAKSIRARTGRWGALPHGLQDARDRATISRRAITAGTR
ncbi:MAG: hypothetical protein GWN84_18275 [Gammaproteobacteria bacterium]|nr:hypothetical protein [Gammaproteobacteria bacterium]NIR84779.1 hypothetical protein [Gammaproteobacteria bacterium]NIR91298.1 hypothetical protein [Gammaproteobacteria bacterium]NIU05826.1 hypothetical protein [Gammaproteobacteria bacterium]NIV76486.1 hypothetical protein [Gammaproteobacteria bacterium]